MRDEGERVSLQQISTLREIDGSEAAYFTFRKSRARLPRYMPPRRLTT
jgi:hypothetical protein